MQEFYSLNEQDPVSTAIPKMQKSMESAASNFSGATFPTENLQVGMTCMRTDRNNRMYKLVSVDPATWEDMQAGADEAAKLAEARTIKLTGKAVGSVSTDFSKDVEINITSVTADTAAKAMTATSADTAKTAASADAADTANTAKKLDHAITVTLTGGATGRGTLDTSKTALDIPVTVTSAAAQNIGVNASTQGTRWVDVPTTRASTLDGSVNEGSGNLTTNYRRYECTAGAIAAGTYSLNDILNRLIKNSHRHVVYGVKVLSNCNCDCTSNCNCGNNDEE